MSDPLESAVPVRVRGPCWYSRDRGSQDLDGRGSLSQRLPPSRNAIFESSLITDPSQVPEAFLERVRQRTLNRTGDTEPRKQ